jgi:protein-S-isoprenylcysteine O-methyltransferase Ste14
MRSTALRLQRFEFEARIFISFGIVLLVCALSLLGSGRLADNVVIVGGWLGLKPGAALRVGYLVVAAVMAIASILRMWAGSVLTSHRMMAFRVQRDSLVTAGPYGLVRNPIYLADLLAFCAFAVCLRPVGLILPVLFYAHYRRLVAFEEKVLAERFPREFAAYAQAVPRRFLPRLTSLRGLLSELTHLHITSDGLRHNALYLLFVPGFVVAAATGSLLWGIVMGVPGVIEWAVVHTRKGLGNNAQEKGR